MDPTIGDKMLERKKKSVIWKLTKDEFANLVKESHSIGEILKHFGLENKGGNSNTVKRRMIYDQLNFNHITLGLGSNKGRKFPNATKIPLEEILVENSDFCRTHLKERLVKENILEYKCVVCDNKGEWLGNKLSLQLDHINGISNDNRLFNLRFICPNCHSQTPTFCGKQTKS